MSDKRREDKMSQEANTEQPNARRQFVKTVAAGAT